MTASYWLVWAGLIPALWLERPARGASESSAAAPLRLGPFRPQQVHLLDGPFRLAFERNRQFLASLDPERQLHTFRLTAGLPTTAKPLGGWEAPGHGGRGEFFGHSLSARALVYAATGGERLKNQLDYLVSELGKCQDALGTNGYLHAEPESVFDQLEAGENVEGIYYTVHKLLAGLRDVYECCGNRQALEIAEKLAHWVHYRSGRLSPERWRKTLDVEFGVESAIRVRIPCWATGGATFKLNGAPLALAAVPSSYAEVRRVWRDGDRLEIEMPMGLHLQLMPDNPNLAALLYGPLVLAGQLGELSAQERHNHNPSPGGLPSPVPEFVTDTDDLTAWIRPVPGKSLEFRTQGQETNVTLQPLCFLFNQRYAVYWLILRRGTPAHAARLAERNREASLLARTVDTVAIGDPESEADHALAGNATATGLGNARRWRHATGGGWFSYRLKVRPDVPMSLRCAFWGDEDPPRRFDILVDGARLATMELNHNKPGEFFAVEHPLPTALTRGKQRVTVQFRAHAGNVAGGLFGLVMLRTDD
jgi:hypothetical protein